MSDPIILGPGDGERVDVAGDRYRFLATASGTDRSYGLLEAIVPPGGGPPPHRHTREEEGFYIVEGELTIHVDGRTVAATAGSFVNMPKGSTHWFRNDSPRPVRLIVLVAPGGMEAMFRRAGEPVADPADPIRPFTDADKPRLARIAAEFGVQIIPPTDPR